MPIIEFLTDCFAFLCVHSLSHSLPWANSEIDIWPHKSKCDIECKQEDNQTKARAA